MKTSLFILLLLGLSLSPAHADECKYHNWDVYKVGKALQQGMTKDALLAHLEGSRKELTPERMEAIRGLIDEAFQLEPKDAPEWWQKHYRKCEDERDT